MYYFILQGNFWSCIRTETTLLGNSRCRYQLNCIHHLSSWGDPAHSTYMTGCNSQREQTVVLLGKSVSQARTHLKHPVTSMLEEIHISAALVCFKQEYSNKNTWTTCMLLCSCWDNFHPSMGVPLFCVRTHYNSRRLSIRFQTFVRPLSSRAFTAHCPSRPTMCVRARHHDEETQMSAVFGLQSRSASVPAHRKWCKVCFWANSTKEGWGTSGGTWGGTRGPRRKGE